MKPIGKRAGLFLLVFLLLAGFSVPVLAWGQGELERAADKAALYMVNAVKSPQVGSIGGEWAVIGLARSGNEVSDEYYKAYHAAVEKYVKDCKGILHQKKYTEYSRVSLALTAIGKDPTDVAGYNLLTPLGDYEKTIWQGLNGPIWALIALDSGNYPMPQNLHAKTQATRDMYVDRILSCQLPDGGFSLFGGTAAANSGDQAADPDITGMALQALAKYQDRADVKQVIKEALTCLSKKQDKNGGFSSWGTANSESVVQVLMALCELGIPLDDSRFVKNGNTLLDNLLDYQQEDGSFRHTKDGSGSNQMASEQGFYGLVGALRVLEGKSSLYRMGEGLDIGESRNSVPTKGSGLQSKNTAVKAVSITKPGMTFGDVSDRNQITAIEALAPREIITGLEDGSFAPEQSMTRAQFAAIIVRALGLTPQANSVFSDVSSKAWYASYVGTASDYGIVTGKMAAAFEPTQTITRQEAAVMVARAAKLCGIDISMSGSEVQDMLSQFTDYRATSSWACPALALCYSQDILSQTDLEIRPLKPVTRGEVVQMIFNLLEKSNLL